MLTISEERKAERALIVKMLEFKDAGTRRNFAQSIGLEWEEWLSLQRKYKYLIREYERRN